MTTKAPYRLFQNPGWGSAIVEAQLAFYGLIYELPLAGDLFDDAAARAAMEVINPVMQVPTLILPSGQVMTESAALTLYLADVTDSDALVPGPDSAERAAFLRWLIFLVTAIYPTFVYGDMPERYVAADQAAAMQARMIAQRKILWGVVAKAAAPGDTWFLGTRFSAIDIYLACMVHWRPLQEWFADHAPGLLAIANRVTARPEFSAVMARNFG